MKVCVRCGIAKENTYKYFSYGKTKNCFKATCRLCRTDITRQWKKRNKEHVKRYGKLYHKKNSSYRKEYSLSKKYNMSLKEFLTLQKAQDYKCGICLEIKRLSVDHCHSTGKVRGLLCINCNTALGNFKDSITRLSRAIAYLAFTRE